MKSFKQFLSEQPTNSVGDGGYTNAANVSGPVAGADPRLFPAGIDDLTQDYQTPAEPGMAKWRFSNVYPVMKLSLSKSSDGPSICLLYTSPSPRDTERSRMPSSA